MYDQVYEILRKRNPTWKRERLVDETLRRLPPDLAPDMMVGDDPNDGFVDSVTSGVTDAIDVITGAPVGELDQTVVDGFANIIQSMAEVGLGDPVSPTNAPETPTVDEVVEPPVIINDVAVEVVPDDLTRIKGIGKTITEKLAEVEITKFVQIAELTDQGVVDLDDILSFKGRILRERWVEQAQAILQE